MTGLDPNPGTRPSRLALARLATDELSGDARAAVAAHAAAAADARAFLAEVDAARAALPPLDLAALRARAAALPAGESALPSPLAAVDAPAPANTFRWFGVGFALLAAAGLALAALRTDDRPLREPVGDVAFRSGDALALVTIAGGRARPYGGEALADGAVVGVQVGAAGHRGVVVLSVDGRGTTSVFWPEAGEAPEPLAGDGLVGLPGSVILDDAPGPEIFVAVFDRTVPEARALVADAFAAGGAEAVRALADAQPGIAALAVARP